MSLLRSRREYGDLGLRAPACRVDWQHLPAWHELARGPQSAQCSHGEPIRLAGQMTGPVSPCQCQLWAGASACCAGIVGGGLPQLPLTVLNSVIAVRHSARPTLRCAVPCCAAQQAGCCAGAARPECSASTAMAGPACIAAAARSSGSTSCAWLAVWQTPDLTWKPVPTSTRSARR